MMKTSPWIPTSREKRKAILYLGTVFSLLFSCFLTAQALLTTLYGDDGFYALIILYGMFGMTAVFSSMLTRVLGVVKMMTIAAITFALFIGAAMSQITIIFLLSSGLLGWMGGNLWVAQGIYLTRFTQDDEHSMGYYNGMFFSLYGTAGVFGNFIIGSLLLGIGTGEEEGLSDSSRTIVLIVLLVLALCASSLVLFAREPPESNEEHLSMAKQFRLTFVVLKKKKMLIWLLYLLGWGLSFGYGYSGFPLLIDQPKLIPWVFAIWGCAFFGSSVWLGKLLDKFPVKRLVLIHSAVRTFCFTFVLFGESVVTDSSSPVIFFFAGICWGLDEAFCNNIVIGSLMKTLPTYISGSLTVLRSLLAFAVAMGAAVPLLLNWYQMLIFIEVVTVLSASVILWGYVDKDDRRRSYDDRGDRGDRGRYSRDDRYRSRGDGGRYDGRDGRRRNYDRGPPPRSGGYSRGRDREREAPRRRSNRSPSGSPYREWKREKTGWDQMIPSAPEFIAPVVDLPNYNPLQSRQQRRLYVGNLPQVSEIELMEFFNTAMANLNVSEHRGSAVQSAAINREKNYAFVEFRSAEEATAGMDLDGITLQGYSLRVRRPKDYTPPAAGENTGSKTNANLNIVSTNVADTPYKIYLGGLPTHLNEGDVKKLLSNFGQLRSFNLVRDSSTGLSKGFGFCEYADNSVTDTVCKNLNGMVIGDKSLTVQRASTNASMADLNTDAKPGDPRLVHMLQISTPASQLLAHAVKNPSTKPTRVLMLMNLLNMYDFPGEIVEDEFDECCEDLMSEFSRYGEVVKMVVPRSKRKPVRDMIQKFFWNSKPENLEEVIEASKKPDEPNPPGFGNVYVEYKESKMAKKAQTALGGRRYDGRMVITSFFPEEKWAKGILVHDSWDDEKKAEDGQGEEMRTESEDVPGAGDGRARDDAVEVPVKEIESNTGSEDVIMDAEAVPVVDAMVVDAEETRN